MKHCALWVLFAPQLSLVSPTTQPPFPMVGHQHDSTIIIMGRRRRARASRFNTYIVVLADTLVQVVWLKVEMAPNQSRRYQVYRIGYWTKKGTWRVYIGYTGQEDVRKASHKRMPPGWVKCRAPCCEAQWRTLESDVVGEQMALALEAFHASRAIVAEPLTVRGGPCVKPTLPKDEDAKNLSGFYNAPCCAVGGR